MGNLLGIINYVCKCFKNEEGGDIGVSIGLYNFMCV